MRENDRRDEWKGRMQRIDAAGLTAIAFHDPKRLDDERRAALADATSADNDVLIMARGLAMVRLISSGSVLVS